MTIRRAIKPLGAGLRCPYQLDEYLLNTTIAGANGIIEVKWTGFYWLQICGAGASSCQQKHQNGASGASGAGFLGFIYLKRGTYKWYVGRQGATNADQNGELSYFIKTDDSYGFHCGGGTVNGNSYNIPPPGGTLNAYGVIKTKGVLFRGNGNPGGVAIVGGWQKYQSPSIFAAITGEVWGQGGQGSNANARQGIVRLQYRK